MRRLLMVLVVVGVASVAYIMRPPDHEFYVQATAETRVEGPVELAEPGDQAVFLVTVTVGPDSAAFEREAGADPNAVYVFFKALPRPDYEGEVLTRFVDTSEPEGGDPRLGTIYLDDCVGGCVRRYEVTVTWPDSEGLPRGLPPGEPLEFTYLAKAQYLLPKPLHESVYYGTPPPEDLSIEVELISSP